MPPGVRDAARSFGKRPPVERSGPVREQLVDAAEHVGRAQVRERAVGGELVVGVLDDHLRAPAAQDLDRARATDRGTRRADDLEDRLVEVRRRPTGTAGAAPSARAGTVGLTSPLGGTSVERGRGPLPARPVTDVAARPRGLGLA